MPKTFKNGRLMLVISALVSFLIAMVTPDIYFISYLFGASKTTIIVLGVSVLVIILLYAVIKPKHFLKKIHKR